MAKTEKKKQQRQRKRLDVRWNTSNMSTEDMERWLDRVIDIYCDAVINNLSSSIDKDDKQR